MDTEGIMSVFKRRGVIWPTAEIYGGAQGLYDYGAVGASIKRRLENAWERWFLGLSDNYSRIEPSDLLPEVVLRSSGHLENFSDALVTCNECGEKHRADALLEEAGVRDFEGLNTDQLSLRLSELKIRCPKCGKGSLATPKAFNLMFGVDFGVEGKERAYLRPETAQGSYLAFSRMWNVTRKRLPFGIAVIGRAYRNEIAPRQALFRQREFTQAELQIFFDPEDYPQEWAKVEGEKLPVLLASEREQGKTVPETVTVSDLVGNREMPPFYAYHMVRSHHFFRDVLLYPESRIRLLEKSAKERAFYNRIQFDIEVELKSLGGYKELGAVHYRGDYDLSRHAAGSKTDLSVTLDGGRHLVPHVIELTFGVDRNLWALADIHLTKEGERTFWALPPYLGPIAAGVLPLIPKEHGTMARQVASQLHSEGIVVTVDEGGSVGRRYARLDEVGVPFAVTVDGTSLADGTVTLRERDTKKQERVAVAALATELRKASISPQPKR